MNYIFNFFFNLLIIFLTSYLFLMDGHCLQHGDEEVRAVASESMEKEVEVDEGVVMQLV